MPASTFLRLDSREISTDDSSESSRGEQIIYYDTHRSIIECKDTNFLQESYQSQLEEVRLCRDVTDHNGMRQRVRDVHLRLPREPRSKRILPSVPISIRNISVVYQDRNEFSVRVYDPAAQNSCNDSGSRPALIMYHGGGWTHGLPEMDEEFSKLFASELRAVVISVNYRLAPEHPFPQPMNDCYAALNWTLDNAADYNIDAKRVALWGFSSGGNLAAAVALKDSIENSTARIKHVNLVVPVTCYPALYPEILSLNGSSAIKFGTSKDADLSVASLERLWEIYASSEVSHAYASVLRTVPSENHPPVHITVAGSDTLRDEGIAYALHLRNHGIDTQLEIIPGVPHEIDLHTKTHASRQYLQNQVRVLNYALNTEF